MAYIELRNVGKVYGKGENKYEALKDISLDVKEGEFLAIMGPSGSGKSTILNMIAGLDTPTSGNIFVNGVDICEKNKSALDRYRRKDIGVVFQQYNLISVLTVRENIELQVRLDHRKVDKKDIDYIINKLGLDKIENKFPSQLSGGEQQRVAIGRSLAVGPMILLADEPTGNLDSETGDEIIKLIEEMSEKNNQTIIMITHDERLANRADRIVRIQDGKII